LVNDPDSFSKQILSEQILQIIQCISVPPILILKIIENLDESVIPKVQAYEA